MFNLLVSTSITFMVILISMQEFQSNFPLECYSMVAVGVAPHHVTKVSPTPFHIENAYLVDDYNPSFFLFVTIIGK